MSILNYTTSIQVEKTVSEIQRSLVSAKAHSIMTEFSELGVLTAISFRVPTVHGVMTFRLPANVEKIFAVITRDKGITPRLKTPEQAARVAWRIIKDWLEAQLALIRAEMVTIDQVFLPYAQNSQGITVYEEICNRKFAGLALPSA